jgi:diguanylate cyclase (GGDEF)-like protein
MNALVAPAPINILLVEDNPGDHRLVKMMLDEHADGQFTLHHASRIAEAAHILDDQRIDIVLLDLRLPDGSGLDSLVKVHALAPAVPIVVLSHVDDESLAVRAVRMGAQDFLLKSHINGALLIRSLRYALERRQIEERLYHLAHHDALTGLPNRKLFYDNLSRALAAARRHRRPLALMMIDLDEFKQINDRFGHHVGDALLREIAERIQSCLRVSDCVARLGGDEFIVYVSDLADTQDARRVAEKILAALEPACPVETQSFAVHASIGIALFPEDGDDMEQLVRNADTAMYLAKGERLQRSSYRFYAHEADLAAVERNATAEALRAALEHEEFVIHYQPQVDLYSGRLIGLEALLRWQRPDGETVPPAGFLPALEQSGLILPVGYWTLQAVCRQAMLWRNSGLAPVKIAVNLSLKQFRDPHLVEQVALALRLSSLDAAYLELELPEAALREDEEGALDTLRQLSALGVRLALDNFCARSISLADLKRYPIHAVKLDGSIVRGMADNAEDAAIAQAIISIAHVFKMKGLAEGVETSRQTDLLREQACDDAQGYAFGRPLTAEMTTQLLRSSGDSLIH